MDGEIQCWRVRNWNRHFENNRTRELKRMDWVPMPNKHDGDGFTELMDHANGMAHYGAWALIAQVAAKCDPRGTLLRDYRTRVRDGAESIKAYDFESLARVTRGSVKVFEEAIPRLISIGWLEVVTISPDGSSELSRTAVRDERQNPAGGCDPSIPFHSIQFPSVPGEGGGGGNPKSKHPASAERPSLEEVQNYASTIGLATWKAADWFDEMEGCGWLDFNRRPIVSWQPVLTRVCRKWEADGRPKGPPSNQSKYDKPNPRNKDCTGDHEQIAKRVAAEVDRRQNRTNQPG